MRRHRLRVVGIGSPNGDDQIGWKLVEGLESSGEASYEAETIGSPMDLLDKLEQCDTLIVVDACQGGLAPGAVVERTWPDVWEGDDLASSHGFGVFSVLQLAENLGKLPPRVIMFGVQVHRCEPGAVLSPELENARPDIHRRLISLITAASQESGVT